MVTPHQEYQLETFMVLSHYGLTGTMVVLLGAYRKATAWKDSLFKITLII